MDAPQVTCPSEKRKLRPLSSNSGRTPMTAFLRGAFSAFRTHRPETLNLAALDGLLLPDLKCICNGLAHSSVSLTSYHPITLSRWRMCQPWLTVCLHLTLLTACHSLLTASAPCSFAVSNPFAKIVDSLKISKKMADSVGFCVLRP